MVNHHLKHYFWENMCWVTFSFRMHRSESQIQVAQILNGAGLFTLHLGSLAGECRHIHQPR